MLNQQKYIKLLYIKIYSITSITNWCSVFCIDTTLISLFAKKLDAFLSNSLQYKYNSYFKERNKKRNKKIYTLF